MAFLEDYYRGLVGAGELESRDRDALIMQGQPLVYGPNDMLDDRTIEGIRKMGGTAIVQKPGGGASVIRPDAGVLPGGDRLISSQEAAYRYGQAQAGGRPLADPAGVGAAAYRQAQNAAELQAYQTADYLAQYLPPERVAPETYRRTGVNLAGKLASTPNLLKRAETETGIAKTRAETESARTMAAEREEDVAKKAQARREAPVQDWRALDNTMYGLNRLEALATELRDAPGLWRAAGPVAGRLPTTTGQTSDIEAKLKTLKSKVARQTLQEIRDASKTGGALGNVSDKDIALLENAIASLELTQTPESFRQAMDEVIAYSDNLRRNAGAAFAGTHGVPEKVLPVAARKQIEGLGEGIPAKLKNGQVWVMRGGMPVRIK
jgi:hypothetical protein